MSNTDVRIEGGSGIKVNPVPPKEYLDECLSYCAETGYLTWKSRPIHHFGSTAKMNRWNALYAGKQAGYAGKDGRRSLSLRYNDINENFLATRLIFQIMEVAIPDGMVIDHINRMRGDDRWENLRIITQQDNRSHSGSMERNSHPTLPRGVYPNGKNKWMAQIQHKKQRIHLGTFSTPELAAAAFTAKAIELRGEYAVVE